MVTKETAIKPKKHAIQSEYPMPSLAKLCLGDKKMEEVSMKK